MAATKTPEQREAEANNAACDVLAPYCNLGAILTPKVAEKRNMLIASANPIIRASVAKRLRILTPAGFLAASVKIATKIHAMPLADDVAEAKLQAAAVGAKIAEDVAE